VSYDPFNHLDAELIQAFLEGEVTAEAEAPLKAHLGRCARCRSEVEAWELVLGQLDQLAELAPSREFGDVVMARVEGLVPDAQTVHLPAEELQDFVEGALPQAAAARVEAHLETCSACTTEVEAWRGLFARLDHLESLAPAPGFGDSVMARVKVPGKATQSWTSRVRSWFSPRARPALAPVTSGHLSPERLQDWVEGILPSPLAARVEAHLEVCAGCHAEATAWQELMVTLAAIPELRPEPAFADRVMARVEVRARSVARVPMHVRVADLLGRLWPSTRRGWAVAAGLVGTPSAAVTAGLVYLFSQPQVTPTSLLLFLWWKVSGMAATLGQGLVDTVGQSALAFRLVELGQSLVGSPGLLAFGALGFSALTLSAVWVLYRNLVSSPVEHRNYAHVST
jgi:anti-sigma factor RsiW